MTTVFESSWENERLKETIAAQAAIIEKLRKSLLAAHDFIGDAVEDYAQAKCRIEVLSTPTNSSQILDDYFKQRFNAVMDAAYPGSKV